MNQMSKQNNKYPKQFQKVFKPSNIRQNNISRSKSRERSTDKSPNAISKIIPIKPSKINGSNKNFNRNSRTPDRPINKTKHERSPNIIKTKEFQSHKYYTKTPSPIPKKSSVKPVSKYNRVVLMTSEGVHHDKKPESIYGTSYNDYSSKNKIVNALNDLNSEIKQIYYKNININNQGKRQREQRQPGYYSTKHNSITENNILKKNNNNNRIWLNTSDLRVNPSPLKYPYGKELYDENGKDTKETKASLNSQFKSIRDANSNYCYSFEDSRCSNSKNIETIEEVHFVFINIIQKSKSLMRLQEKISDKNEENAFDTVMICDEKEFV